jgi:hypothetical protein
MNYLKVYCNLIRNAENRTRPEGYTEKHHTFPLSIFGKNKRVVALTAREHYIAHSLLEKICIQRYGINHWKTIKMNNAHIGMKGNGRYVNSYLYESAKKRRSNLTKGKKPYEMTDETRKKISEIRKGKPSSCGMKGKKHNEESKRKMSDAHKGRPGTCGFTGKNHTKEFKDRMKTDNPMWRDEIKNKFIGKRHSEESINKMKKSKRKYIYTFICPEGNEYETDCSWEFCNERGLDASSITKVIKGKLKTHKGWAVTRESKATGMQRN